MGKASLRSSKTWAGSGKGKMPGRARRMLLHFSWGHKQGPVQQLPKAPVPLLLGCAVLRSRDSWHSSLHYKTHRFLCGSI